MRKGACFVAIGVLLATTAAAQTPPSRWYLGVATGATNVITDEVNGGGMSTLSGLVAFRATRTLAVEVDLGVGLDQQSRERVGWRVSFAGPEATRTEIEDMAVTERIRSRSRQTFNATVMVVWREANPGRVTASLFAGPTWNRYEHEETSEVLRLPPGVTLDQFRRTLPGAEGARSKLLGGLTAGVSIPVAVTRGIRVAPEFSYTHGDVGDHHYHLVSARAKLLWRF